VKPTAAIEVGVVLERQRSTSVWADVAGGVLWVPASVLPAAPDLAPFTRLGQTAAGELFVAGRFAIPLHRTETANYRDNLATGAPRIWIALRASENAPGITVIGVTPDPAEGESYTEAGPDIVGHVAMPSEIAAQLADFVAEHHVERPFIKRRRRDWSAETEDDFA
jgi:hypothetical protein